ncbi:MAG: inositol monophosphatase [Candidatus Dormibacteria bacterium]
MRPGAANPDLELALRLADEADAITLRHFRSSELRVSSKADRSPVSNADEEVEEMLRARLGSERPGDVIDGEEFGSGGEGARRWIVDPVDGTRNYVRGIPVYATLIALVVSGEPQVGVVSAPAMAARWWAARGEGAFGKERPMSVSRQEVLSEATVGHGHLDAFRKAELLDRFMVVCDQVYQPRGFGDFWQHMMVASGTLDACVDPIVSPWDVAAVQVIVEEAGGRFTDLAGRRSITGGNAVSSNGALHDAVLSAMRQPDPAAAPGPISPATLRP